MKKDYFKQVALVAKFHGWKSIAKWLYYQSYESVTNSIIASITFYLLH